MSDLVRIDYANPEQPTVSGRELHEFLEVKTPYKDWFPRMCEYGFEEGRDYGSFLRHRSDGLPGKPRTDHRLTVSMAKELCMLQRTEKGKQARQYFLRVEARWNDPDVVVHRALVIANARVENLWSRVQRLEKENSSLAASNRLMQSKADYYDRACDRGGLTNFRETANLLGIGQRALVALLLEKKFVYRDRRGKLCPYARHLARGLFEVKEQTNSKTGWRGAQTLVTAKGRAAILRAL